MKIYSHDYTLPAEVQSELYELARELRKEGSTNIAERIENIYMKLREYLDGDNLVEDPDCDGLIKASDYFAEKENDHGK